MTSVFCTVSSSMASSSHLPKERHFLAMPYPGRGHINPMMNLCKSLISRVDNLVITFVVTEEWLGFLGSDPAPPPSIRYATIPNVIPSEHVRGQDMRSFLESVMTKMEAPLKELLDKLDLEQPPSFIIADVFLIWAVEVAKQRSLPVAVLWPMSSTMFSMCHHFDLLVQNGHFPIDLQAMSEVRVDYIPGVSRRPLSAFPTVMTKDTTLLDRSLAPFPYVSKSNCLLLSHVYDLEPQVVDELKSEFEIPVYCLGPSFPHSRLKQEFPTDDQVDYITWLNKQAKKSVLYISFGSFCSTSTAQMDEIAAGLKQSRAKFLWVARNEAPRLREIFGGTDDDGLVVQWCDQLRVLSHDAIIGFWSHCGWSSTQEGFFTGVTFLTFPLLMDQEPNSHMIVEDLKVGWRVRGTAGVEGLVMRDEIGEIVRRFMDGDASEVKEMRLRAEELKMKCRRAVDAGGSYELNFNGFVDFIMAFS